MHEGSGSGSGSGAGSGASAASVDGGETTDFVSETDSPVGSKPASAKPTVAAATSDDDFASDTAASALPDTKAANGSVVGRRAWTPVLPPRLTKALSLGNSSV